MNKASERYNTKVEIPISVILETIFSDDNHDVETLCRWAKHYEFVDLVKENENDKLGYYKLQDDYTKQSFYVLLDKEERKQYDYEDYLLDKLEEKDKEIERLKAREQECIDKYLAESKYRSELEGKYVVDEYIINELEKWLEDVDVFQMNFIENKEHITPYKATLEKLKELKEGKQ